MGKEIRYTVAKITTSRPSMYTPTIKISSETLSIEDTLNGSFLGGYKIYCDGNYLASVGAVKTVDLGQFEYPSVSSYKITVKAFSDYFNDSPASNEVLFSESKAYSLGGEGAIDVAEKVLEVLNNKNDFKVLYEDELSLVEKVNRVAKEIYRAKDVEFSEIALEKLNLFEEKGLGKLPICIAKTQYSFSDDAKAVGAPNDFVIHVRDVRLYNGAGFITVLLGDIMTMPGLSRKPIYEIIDVVDGNIVGLN